MYKGGPPLVKDGHSKGKEWAFERTKGKGIPPPPKVPPPKLRKPASQMRPAERDPPRKPDPGETPSFFAKAVEDDSSEEVEESESDNDEDPNFTTLP